MFASASPYVRERKGFMLIGGRYGVEDDDKDMDGGGGGGGGGDAGSGKDVK